MIQNSSYLISRNGIYYYSRRVPADLHKRFNKDRVIISLRTRSQDKALRSAQTLSDRLERYWESLRLELFHSRELDLYVRQNLPASSPQSNFTLDDALELYLSLKGSGRRKTFFQVAHRAVTYLKETAPAAEITALTFSDALTFREHLFSKGLTSSSVRRIFSCIKSILNLAIKERGLNCNNPFAATFIPDDLATKRRLPIPLPFIHNLQTECMDIDDDNRWLIALISDTGMRLSEAAGLHVKDISVSSDIPHVNLRAYPWRPLKTKSSERQIPLVGASLWAAKRIVNSNHEFAFPSYIKDKELNSNSASAAINKWLKPRVPDGCVVHSFRHSFRDRLRNIECPSDIVDSLGGWTTTHIGQKYGLGYDLKVKQKWLKRIEVLEPETQNQHA